ncbi:MAG: discoidin domain-containing protein [Planctomycetes bacterium]|nr:discoidin domain-containing protein [Planctomycetota bacterium]
MKIASVLLLALLAVLVVSGCEKKAPTEEPQAPESETQSPVKEVATPAEKESKLVPIPLVLPKPMFVGTPQNLSGVENLEKPLGKARPVFLAPEGTQNLALNKPVISSEMEPITGDLEMVVDGDKDATEGSVVELGPFEQWVQIDLEKKAEIYAIVLWHYHKTPRVYFDIVVQVSSDEEFIDATTIYNNDMDNSLGRGVGVDKHYVETAEGQLIDAKGVKGRYVRLYSQANNQNDYSHYIEVEVFGK